MSKSKCPNINDKEYKALSAVVGDGRAHTIYSMNNGNPVSLTADGIPSSIYNQLVERHGIDKAVEMRSKMFTDRYQVLSGNILFNKNTNRLDDLEINKSNLQKYLSNIGFFEINLDKIEILSDLHNIVGFKLNYETSKLDIIANEYLNLKESIIQENVNRFLDEDNKSEKNRFKNSFSTLNEVTDPHKEVAKFNILSELKYNDIPKSDMFELWDVSDKEVLQKFKPENSKIYLVDRKTFTKGANGIYWPDNDNIYLPVDNGKFDKQSLLHELVHAGTVTRLEKLGKNSKEYIELNDLFNYVKNNLNSPRFYGTTNLNEFLSEAFTNQIFQDALAGIPSRSNISVFDHIIDLIRRIFKVDVENSVLHDIMRITNDILKTDKPLVQSEPILDSQDNLIFADGTTIQLGDKVAENKATSNYKLLREYVETSRSTEAFISTLERSIPGFNINVESHETVQDTIHKNDRAWVDREGVHLNTQTMHYDTPIHEVTHLWIHALEMSDITKYNQFMDKIVDSVKYNKEIMDTVKKKYPELSDKYQLYEYAAALSGMVSAKDVRKFLSRNNRYATDKRINEIYLNEIDTVKDFYVNVGNVISNNVLDNNGTSSLADVDFETGILNDIFQALTNDILDGKRVINFTPTEVQQLLSKYYSDNAFEADRGFDQIVNIKQITPYLIGTDIVDDNTDKMVDYIYTNLNPHGNRAQKVWYDYGKPFYFPNNQPEEEIRRRIKEEIIVRRKSLLNSFNDNIVEVLNKHLDPQLKYTPLEELITQAYSNYDLSDDIVDNIVRSLKLLGIDEPMTKVMNYSELEKDSKLSFLYNASLLGHNPLVIQHTDSNDKIDISIVDLTGSVLGWEENQNEKSDRFLADELGYKQSVNKNKKLQRKFNMANNQGDIRQVLIATTIAGMNKLAQEKGKKLNLRRFGVIGFNGHTVKPHMISSIQNAMVNARDLFTLPAVQGYMDEKALSYNWFQELLSDDKAWSEDSVQQSWVDALETYYAAFYQQLGLNEVQKNSLLSEVNSETHYRRIKDRARQIEWMNSNWENNAEHKLLTRFIMQYESGNHSVAKSQVTDINKTFMYVTNVHNIKSDILQNYSIQAENDKSIIVDQVNVYKKQFTSLLEKSLQSRGKTIHIIGNSSQSLYEHLFKDGELLLSEDHKALKAGQVVKVKQFNKLYGSYDLAEAKKAGLTTEDIALADFIYNTIKERYVQNALHQNSKKANPTDVTKVREQIEGSMIPGNIPVMDMTKAELAREAKIKEFIIKGYNEIAISELMVGMEDVTMDNDLGNKDYQHVHSRFSSQATMQQQMRLMGLKNTGIDDRYEGKMKFYENHTMNLERVFNLFVDDSIRMIELENRTIPALNVATQWMNILEEEYNIKQDNTRKFLKEYVNRTMLNKTEDDPTDKLAHLVRNITQAYSFIALGGRPLVWTRSAYFNTQAQIVEELSISATNRMLKDGESLNMPSTSDITKANLEVALHHKKTLAIARKLGIVDGSEMEAIESFFLTHTDNNIFQSEFAHIGNYYTDRFARIVAMVGFMIHDGSYDAHSYDEVTQELKYDKFKDKSFFNSNGEFKSGKEEAIWKRKIEEMKNAGLVGKNGEMEVGYSFKEANTRFKYYADKYIIGSMDPYQKVMLGNTYAGRSVTQFRTFLPEKLANVFMSRRTTSYGGEITAEQDENGKWITKRSRVQVEGTVTSVLHLFDDVIKVIRTKDMTFADLEKMDPMTKYNLVKSIIKGTMFLTIMSSIYLLGKGLSDRDKDKLSWLYSELMSYSSLEQIKKNIIPITGLFDTIMRLVSGGSITQLLKYTGPFYDLIFAIELFGSNDNIMRDWTTIKLEDMNEKQLKEHAEKLEIRRLKREAQKDNE